MDSCLISSFLEGQNMLPECEALASSSPQDCCCWRAFQPRERALGEKRASCQVGHGQAGRPNVPKQRREDSKSRRGQNHIPNFILMGLVQNLVTEPYSVPGHDCLGPWHLLGWLRNLSSCLLLDEYMPWQGHRNGTLYQLQSP